MANAPAGTEDSGRSGRAKLPIPLLLLVVMFGTWLGLAAGGGAFYFLAKSGKLPIAHAEGKAASGDETSRQVVLEPILVNLADQGGHAYLRLGLTLDLVGEMPAAPEAGATKEKSKPENAIRDIVLTVLGRETSTYLLGPDGKEHLKIELKEAITKSDLKVKVKDLYFSDFLVQQ